MNPLATPPDKRIYLSVVTYETTQEARKCLLTFKKIFEKNFIIYLWNIYKLLSGQIGGHINQ